jgi:hypothetical protein
VSRSSSTTSNLLGDLLLSLSVFVAVAADVTCYHP